MTGGTTCATSHHHERRMKARKNGKITPITTQRETEKIMAIQTCEPSWTKKDWVVFLKTSKVRNQKNKK